MDGDYNKILTKKELETKQKLYSKYFSPKITQEQKEELMNIMHRLVIAEREYTELKEKSSELSTSEILKLKELEAILYLDAKLTVEMYSDDDLIKVFNEFYNMDNMSAITKIRFEAITEEIKIRDFDISKIR